MEIERWQASFRMACTLKSALVFSLKKRHLPVMAVPLKCLYYTDFKIIAVPVLIFFIINAFLVKDADPVTALMQEADNINRIFHNCIENKVILDRKMPDPPAP